MDDKYFYIDNDFRRGFKNLRVYRKVKLNMTEIADKQEAEELGLNKSVIGDNDGYFYNLGIEDIGEEVWGRKFAIQEIRNMKMLNLPDLIEAGVVVFEGDDYVINKENIDQLPTRIYTYPNKDFGNSTAMRAGNYTKKGWVRLSLIDAIKEIVKQYQTNGRKGTKINNKYMDKYNLKIDNKTIERDSNKELKDLQEHLEMQESRLARDKEVRSFLEKEQETLDKVIKEDTMGLLRKNILGRKQNMDYVEPTLTGKPKAPNPFTAEGYLELGGKNLVDKESFTRSMGSGLALQLDSNNPLKSNYKKFKNTFPDKLDDSDIKQTLYGFVL